MSDVTPMFVEVEFETLPFVALKFVVVAFVVVAVRAVSPPTKVVEAAVQMFALERLSPTV